ncbi:hypothetical protein KAI60_04390, partial [Candidatus Bathyarchaeota archaeon]|nr:hypothetical protein [Candidatus Bathyarchaeota archaeon]
YDVRSYVSSFPSFEIVSSLTEGGVTSLFILLRFPLSQATDYFESILPHFTKFHAAETIYFETATTTSLIPPIAFP